MRTIFSAFGFLLLFGAGCATPIPSYQRVNQRAPEFKAAVADTAQRLQDSGISARAAEESATKQVTADFIAAEAKRRADLVAPLARALKSLAEATGCWACTIATTTANGKLSYATIEQFDPSQADDRRWTLVSANGRAPSEFDQTAFHGRHSVAAAPAAEIGVQRSDRRIGLLGQGPDEILAAALKGDLEVITADPTVTTFVFHLAGGDSGRATAGPTRFTYVVDRASGSLRREEMELTKGSGLMGGSKFTYDRFESIVELETIDLAQPPFVAKITSRSRIRVGILGSEELDLQTEKTYTGYRRVPCHDERFQVKMGPLEEIDTLLPH